MKVLVEEYSFSASLKQVIFNGSVIPDTLERLLLVTNVTSGDIIYNFADKLRGGSLIGNVLTLTFDTTKMSDSDRLQIFIDVPDPQADLAAYLRKIVKQLEAMAVVDVSLRQRVVVEALSGSNLGVQVSATGQGGGVPATNWPTAGAPTTNGAWTVPWQPVWIGPVDQRYQIIDQARTAYATGIRSNLINS